MLADSDGAGRQAATARKRKIASADSTCDVPLLDFYPDRDDGSDVADWLGDGHTVAELRALVDAAPPYEPSTEAPSTIASDDAAIVAAAKLSPVEYDQQRKEIAKRHGIRIATLDKMVAAMRPQDQVQGQALEFEQVEPHAEPVNGATLLDEVAAMFGRHVVLLDGAADAVALWCIWTYVVDLFDIAPMLGLTSATKRCGKTRLLGLIMKIVARPLAASNISQASVFRVTEKWHPTLGADEADSYFKDNEQLRGVLNSGHTRDAAFVIRCEGEDNEPRRFSTWGAKVWAAIGVLASTLMDRSIVIPMKRCAPGETFVKRLPADSYFATLRARIVRWTNDHSAQIRSIEAVSPKGLDNRAEDNWTPLLAIAEVAGGAWPTRAHRAAEMLSSVESEDALEVGVQLVHDIRRAFNGDDRLHTNVLLARLNAMPESPWPTYCRGRELTARALANLLRAFGISSHQLKIDDVNHNGYEAKQFDDTLARYPAREELGAGEGSLSSTDSTAQQNRGFASKSHGLPEGDGRGYENGGNARQIRPVGAVEDKKPPVPALSFTKGGKLCGRCGGLGRVAVVEGDLVCRICLEAESLFDRDGNSAGIA
ncbi:MAG TPA: DUF3631 domain-containing protein [Candidatus Dormibacteraeota bacterium]|nr:DUF3631 domain-containing protein [Candidatus Dormibacteraeota bacterium]